MRIVRSRNIHISVMLTVMMIDLTSSHLIAASDEPGVPMMIFVMISPSTYANAMEQSYGSTYHNSPIAIIFNLASLSFFARENNFGSSFYKRKVDWLPNFRIEGLWYDASSLALGINLKDYSDIPVSFGLGFHEVYLDLGETEGRDELNNPTGKVNTWGKSKGTTISAAWDYIFRASFGYTWARLDSHLSNAGAGQELGSGIAKIYAHDFGFIVEAPVISLFESICNSLEYFFSDYEFYYNPGCYYSKSNIGGKAVYIDRSHADPIPRTVSVGINSVGINLKAGVSYIAKSGVYKLFAFNWSREVDDMLIEKLEFGSTVYKSGLHDIKFWKNVIRGQSNNKVDALKEGYELNFVDVFFLLRGRYEDHEGKVYLTTKG